MTDTSAKIDKILEATGAESIEEANVILNEKILNKNCYERKAIK